jgi:hypothetical protein
LLRLDREGGVWSNFYLGGTRSTTSARLADFSYESFTDEEDSRMSPMTKRAAVALTLLAAILVPSGVKIGSFFFDTLMLGSASRDVRQAQDRIFPKVIEDLKAWGQADLARELASRERDAGPALNRKLEWKGDLAGYDLEPLTTPDGPALMAACDKFPECGSDAFNSLNLATNAFDIFSQAMEFDHWSDSASSPVESLAKAHRLAVDSRKPTPDFRRIRGLGRAYLLTSLKEKDANVAVAAFTQALHMGKLLLTQQTPEAAAAGVAILDDVRAAYDMAIETKALDVGAIVPVASEDLRRFERLAQAVPAFFEPLTDPDRLEQILALDRTGSFACLGAARQFSPEGAALLAYVEPTIPGEADYRPYAAVATKAFAPSSPCQLPFEREAWDRREELRLAELESVRSIPWLRRSYFLMRATTSATDAAIPASVY